MRSVHIGTSGWHYLHWRGPFYPEGIAAERMLGFYRWKLDSVEINNTFYNLPSEKTFTVWRECVPRRFLFAVKASRHITHLKKLKDVAVPLKRFVSRVEILGARLGPILFQLPPRWKCNPGRLEDFLKRIPERKRCAFELRDPSWFDTRVYELLAEYNAAFCIYDFDGRQSPREVTADFVYVRLHGPGARYQGVYEREALASWAAAISAWVRAGKDVYCYFDNDQNGYAARNAVELRDMLA